MTKTKSTKRALLMSGLALLMCVSMLIGSTFAWFTDSVNTGINNIQSGNLDIELWHCVPADTTYGFGFDETNGEQITGDTALFLNVDGDPILWEPGVEAAEAFRIKNVGSLALKYQFRIKAIDATKTSEGKDLTDVITMQIIELENDELGVPVGAGLEYEALFGEGYVIEGELLAGESTDFNVCLDWYPSENDNAFNVPGGLKLTYAVDLIATQLTYEKDSYDDQYDKDATYPLTSNAELDEAIKAGETNITLASGTYIIPDSAAGKTLTIVGNGDTVVAVQDDGSYEGCDYSLLGSNVTFENITITLPGGNYRGWASMDATFNNCTINGMMTLYGDTVFNNCTFNISGDAYNIWTWGADKVEFNDCTFNTDGKSILVYNQSCDVYVNGCTFNDSTNGTGFTKSAIETGVDGAGAATYNIYITDTTVNGFAENDVKVGYKNVVGNKNSMTNEYLNIVVDGNDVH